MPTRLLIGVAEAGAVNEPRRHLLDVLERLVGHDVAVQVAMFEDGPVRRELEKVADVRVIEPRPPRSPGGLVQSAARRVSLAMADRVHDARVRADRRWIRSPDAIHLHGPKAAPLLRYVRDPAIAVTAYSHHVDFSIAGLQPLDLARLLARTHRYLVDEESVVSDLLAAGVDPDRIHLVDGPVAVPAAPPDRATRQRARSRRELRADATVVAVAPVPDWYEFPDLTLAVGWELERRMGSGGPVLWWWGMPDGGEPRWAVEHELEHLGVGSVVVDRHEPSWDEVLEVADLVLLPSRTPVSVPDDLVARAAVLAQPVLCAADHPAADVLGRAGATIVPVGDVGSVTEQLIALSADPVLRSSETEASWTRVTTGFTELFGVPLSRASTPGKAAPR